MKKSFSQKYRAFTLVEMLLVMAIIGIMSAVLFASLTSNRSASRLKAAQREVASTIKLAQTYALQGKTQDNSGVQTTPCGYGIFFTNITSYKLFYNDLNGAFPDCEAQNESVLFRTYLGGSQVAESYSLKNNVELSVGFFGTLFSGVYFAVPHANAYNGIGSAFASQTYTLKISGTALTKTATINSSGFVTEIP